MLDIISEVIRMFYYILVLTLSATAFSLDLKFLVLLLEAHCLEFQSASSETLETRASSI